jgi:hypothetical protein
VRQIPDAVDIVVCAPDVGWKYHLKYVEQFPDINKLCNVASCWIYIRTLLGAHCILHISRIKVKGQRRYSYCNEICQSYKEMELTKNIIWKTPFGGSCDEDEAGKGAQHCTERVCRRKTTN